MRRITEIQVNTFLAQLRDEEKSEATIEKYRRDVYCFRDFIGEEPIDKQSCMKYKAYISEKYAVASVNSMIASLNSFFKFCGWYDCCLRQLRVQKRVFCCEEKELSKAEYTRLIHTARFQRNERLYYLLQTICSTGIRVSELRFITVEAVRKGLAIIQCKGKTREILIVSDLKKCLLKYVRKIGLESGSIFVTKSGKPIDRSNIWREMKALCKKAKVSEKKVFPHNLRHLFARLFYKIEKDIAKLADVLGHSSINTTRIYIISTGSEHRRTMEHMHLIL